MQRSLQRMVRSMCTESVMRSLTLLSNSQDVRSAMSQTSGVLLAAARARAALGRPLSARQRRGLEDLLAEDLGWFVLPLAVLTRVRSAYPLAVLAHIASCDPS